MARAKGINAALLFKYESSYGVDPAGNYQTLPFISADLGADQGLIPDDVIGLGRDPQAPTRDLIRAGGQVTVPLDARSIGYWLRLAFDAPTTTGADPYAHTFVSGVASGLPSAAIELGFSEVPSYHLNLGLVVDSIRFELSRTGTAQAVITLKGQDEQKNATSQGGTPVASPVMTRFHQVHGNIQRNAVNLADVESATMEYRNNYEDVETIRADALVEGQDEGVAALTGSVTSRFASTTLYDDAVAGTGLDIDVIYTIDANNKLTVSGQDVYLPRTRQRVDGPGGVSATFDFQGAKDSGEGEMMEVILINNVVDYDIA